MQFIQGKNRSQVPLYALCLDETIDQDNEVRIIDLFVESIDISDYQFVIKQTNEGRPAYHPKVLLKLFVYGYLNSIRSSRSLEKECKRNIELMWLMKELVPDHNTISNFRRDNEKAIRKIFRYTVSIARQFDLIGGKLIAGDSTKLRAQNSKKVFRLMALLSTPHTFSAGLSSGLYGGRKIKPIFLGMSNRLALWKAPLSKNRILNSCL